MKCQGMEATRDMNAKSHAPSYRVWTAQTPDEFVVFCIFRDKVCLWNSGYVNISRMILILEWLARRLASLYSITRLNIYWQRIWMKIETCFYSTNSCFSSQRRKFSLDEQSIMKILFILMYDIIFKKCWLNGNFFF